MGKTSKKNRKDNQNEARWAQQRRFNADIMNQVKQQMERNIRTDLEAESFPGSGKPQYTYEEIAERNGCSETTVWRIARKYGLTRRGMNHA